MDKMDKLHTPPKPPESNDKATKTLHTAQTHTAHTGQPPQAPQAKPSSSQPTPSQHRPSASSNASGDKGKALAPNPASASHSAEHTGAAKPAAVPQAHAAPGTSHGTPQVTKPPSVLKKEDLEFFQNRLEAIRSSLRSNIIGQEELLRHLLLALIGGGHILIEGVPGLAKTLSVRSLAQSLQLSCKRIQFTPDLLPADLIGTMIFHQSKDEFVPRHGPIFTQVLLADEINRAPAKVQSALLEAMGEQQVTIGDTSYQLPKPFFVMATQNPIEEEGTYPLPAAQLDRFDMKFVVHYPSPQDELQLLMQYQHQQLGFQKKERKDSANPPNLSGENLKDTAPSYHLSPQDLFRMREIASQIHLGEALVRYIINIVNATRETNSHLEFSRYLDLGASPRASLALSRYAVLNALFSGRDYALPNDIKMVCPAVLRHRLLLSYEAEAANQSSDDVIQQILQTVVVP